MVDSLQEIIGHEAIKVQINNSISVGMFSHAHLIIGEDGIGKSLLAKGIAFKILGKEKERQYADIIEYKVAKNKQSIGIREVVENIIEEINKKPYESDKKVIIIYEADKMTVDAQNAFLKTIEEPPKGVFIILLCENSESILETIKSRCQVHKLQRINKEEMIAYLSKKYPKLTAEDLKPVLAFSDGIPGRAERFLEDQSFKEIRNAVISILEDVTKDKNIDTSSYEEFFSKYKSNWKEILTWFLSYIRDILVYKDTGNDDLIVNIDKINNVKEAAIMFSFNKLNDIIDIVNETRQKLERNVNAALVFDIMLLNIQDV